MTRHRSSYIASLLAVLSVLHATSLRAQSSDPNVAAAEYRKAYAAVAKEDWPTAREIFFSIWKTNKTYDVASSLAQVEFKLEHYGSAARFMAFALEHVAPSEKPEFIQRLKNGLRELRLRVGTVRISVNEPGAEIALEEEILGTSPLTQEVFLDPGKHVIFARKHGRTAKLDVLAKAGEFFDVTLTLPAAPPPSSGLGIDTAPRSEVTTRTDAPSQHPSIVPVVVGGTVFVASLATAIGLRISANASYSDADELRRRNGPQGCTSGTASPADCAAQAEANSSGDDKANFSTAAFTVAGGALLATAAYWFWPRHSDARASRPRTRLQGSITNSSGFLGISYDF
jgi:hypothetical protein